MHATLADGSHLAEVYSPRVGTTGLVGNRWASDHADVRVIPPPCPVDIKPGDFSHAAELIEQTYASTVAWLKQEAGPRAANPLADHDRIAHRG